MCNKEQIENDVVFVDTECQRCTEKRKFREDIQKTVNGKILGYTDWAVFVETKEKEVYEI